MADMLILLAPIGLAVCAIGYAIWARKQSRQDAEPTQPFAAPVESVSAASSGGGGGPKEPA